MVIKQSRDNNLIKGTVNVILSDPPYKTAMPDLQ